MPIRTRAARLLMALAALVVGALTALPATAYQPPRAYIAIDASSGRELLSEAPDLQVHPASLTKMMTLYLLFDALRSGRLKMNSRIRFSRNAARQPPSKLGVRAGRSITVRTAIYALAVKSANDVAVAVAERLARTEERFADRMNAKARAIGMPRTHFENASGLHDPLQVTTPRDMAMLARALRYKHKRYYKFFKASSFKYGRRTVRGHNKFLKAYKGADGIKTGYIRASGFNLAGSAVRNNRRVIAVVIGGETAAERDLDMVGIMDAGFRLVRSLGKPRYAGIAPVSLDFRKGRPASPPRRPGTTAPGGAPSFKNGAYAAQVGAVGSKRAAQALAGRRLNDLGRIASGGAPTVKPLAISGGRTLYRARIAGLTGPQARRACAALRLKGRDCLVVGPPTPG